MNSGWWPVASGQWTTISGQWSVAEDQSPSFLTFNSTTSSGTPILTLTHASLATDH